MEDKDYNLLRPFDPKTAKAGDMLCSIRGNLEREFVAGPDHSGRVCVAIEGDYNLVWPSDLRLAPLYWVEGRPAYEGDVLYSLENGRGVILKNHKFSGGYAIQFENAAIAIDAPYFSRGLTWTPPKVKRDGWGVARIGLTKKTREEAEEVIGQLYFCSKEEAYRNMINFEFNDDSPFKDWWEVDTDEYSFYFLWCCYALAWGVAKYDAAKEAEAQTKQVAA